MNRQTSIALHLARVMEKAHVLHTYPDGQNQAVLLVLDDWKQLWSPSSNLSQWAECVLWAAGNGLEPLIMRTTASAWSDAEMKDIRVGAGSPEGIQAATLEAIARATGWPGMEG